MIIEVFNSSIVSGPETLVVPTLNTLSEPALVIFLSETRCKERSLGPPAYARSFGLEVIEVEVRSRWDQRAIQELRHIFETRKPRLVHAHEVKASAYVAAASSPSRDYRLVTTNHGVRAKKAPVLRFYEWLFTRWIMPKYDRIFCVCSSDRTLLIARGVDPQKILVHLNGVDRPKCLPAQRAEESARIRKLWNLETRGVKPGAICLGVVGRLAPEKRHAHILEVFQKLREIEPQLDAHLVIFGTGALEQSLREQTTRLGLESSVHWMGYRNTVGTEMAGFDLLLSLSSAEGLPINVIEAGWAATPVFATAVDGNLDLIPTPEFGRLVTVQATVHATARQLADTLTHPGLMPMLGEKLQSHVERHFSGVVWKRRLEELYRFS